MNKDEAEETVKGAVAYAGRETESTKKRFRSVISVTALVLAAVILFFAVKPVSCKYAESDLYTQNDIKTAMDCVKTDFKSLHGCRLFSLSYSGDAKSLRETEYRMKHGPQYDGYIVIDSVFLSPLSGAGAWNNGEIYTWSWTLGRNTGGEWTVIDRGYC